MFHVDKTLVEQLNMISHRYLRMIERIDWKSFNISVVEWHFMVRNYLHKRVVVIFMYLMRVSVDKPRRHVQKRR